MDKNKLAELHAIHYRIDKCCGMCSFGEFPNPQTNFGTCRKKIYVHLKHTGDARQLSVNRYGKCRDDFAWSPTQSLLLGKFNEFMED